MRFQTKVLGRHDENIRIRLSFQTKFDGDFTINTSLKEMFKFGKLQNKLAVAA